MTENDDLSKEFLKQADKEAVMEGSADQNRLASETFRQEQKRVRVWAGLTIALWIAAAGWAAAVSYSFLVFFYPKLVDSMIRAEGPAERMDTDFLRALAHFILYSNIVWPILLVAAAVCTTLFILKSRRATLQQIQERLAGISSQIRELASSE